jgi:hypothetical protein
MDELCELIKDRCVITEPCPQAKKFMSKRTTLLWGGYHHFQKFHQPATPQLDVRAAESGAPRAKDTLDPSLARGTAILRAL